MSSSTLIPSIAGAPVARWAAWFESHVAQWSEQGLPLKGSLGIDFSVKQDLTEVCSAKDGDRAAMHAYLKASVGLVTPCPGFAGPAKPITDNQVGQVLDFYFWAQSEQPYFYLRRGTKTLGLYRKTSGYVYSAPETLKHRVSYEFVRPLTPEESGRKLGQVPQTVLWMEAEVPVAAKPSAEQALDETMARLQRTRAAIGLLVGDLETALARFSSSVN